MREYHNQWVEFTRRTDDPKLAWLEQQLKAKGIESRRHGESFHAPILQVHKQDLEKAWELLPIHIDNLPDDHPMFVC